MANPEHPKPSAAGVLLAITILAGATIGMIWREPSAGLVGGIVIGATIAVLYWLRDRRRTGL